MKYVPSTAKVKFAVIDVALVKVTVLAAVTAPVELIASTCGIVLFRIVDLLYLLLLHS
jgi:hypothetical protein